MAVASKGFKVTDGERKNRVGIAAKSLAELRAKTMEKFQLGQGGGSKSNSSTSIRFQTQDGTIVDNEEYFGTLPAQSVLIWVREGQHAQTDAELLYKTIREVNEEYLSAGEQVQDFFSEQMKCKVMKLAQVLKSIDDADKAKLSNRTEHPDWFQGLESRARTKEEYMAQRSRERIRGYFYKTKSDLMNRVSVMTDQPTVTVVGAGDANVNSCHSRLRLLCEQLSARLSTYQCFGCYFDRRNAQIVPCQRRERSDNVSSSLMMSLCDENGTFRCQGRWDKSHCLYEHHLTTPHRINPYCSREERVLFSTWNLDHRVERSREVVPAILEALMEDKRSLDVDAIFRDLFTLKNLKLVHIVCHDKGAHSYCKAGPYLL